MASVDFLDAAEAVAATASRRQLPDALTALRFAIDWWHAVAQEHPPDAAIWAEAEADYRRALAEVRAAWRLQFGAPLDRSVLP
jgi:hypothetical protein